MLTFVVHVRRSSAVLARVVLLFHGRRIEIDSLVAGRVGKSEVLRIEVAIVGDRDRAQLIEANLYKLADVLPVERNDPD
jgi:acetolactate synthase small subunit